MPNDKTITTPVSLELLRSCYAYIHPNDQQYAEDYRDAIEIKERLRTILSSNGVKLND